MACPVAGFGNTVVTLGFKIILRWPLGLYYIFLPSRYIQIHTFPAGTQSTNTESQQTVENSCYLTCYESSR
jgi:hypothetical protein